MQQKLGRTPLGVRGKSCYNVAVKKQDDELAARDSLRNVIALIDDTTK